ncbi:MAG: BrxE family protein [Polyangiaceae bacterium]|nr:BrxE family protein [Polyangiaceae bacterium]
MQPISCLPAPPGPIDLDLDRLLKLRLVVARFGEMDLAKWWNTKGQLGRLGAAALRRGFPRTHRFAQARSVFAVAAYRCTQVFEPPNCVTLWHLPESIEADFDARWEHWLDHASEWTAFFEKLESLSGTDLTVLLRSFELVSDSDVEAYGKLKRSAEGRAVSLPGIFSGTDADVVLLALGFARGEPSALAVPYARKAEA